MAKVFVVDDAVKADIKVFAEEKEFKADMLYAVVEQEFNGKGDCLWFYVNQQKDADLKIFWVGSECQADLRVCKVDRAHKARWVKKSPFFKKLSSQG